MHTLREKRLEPDKVGILWGLDEPFPIRAPGRVRIVWVDRMEIEEERSVGIAPVEPRERHFVDGVRQHVDLSCAAFAEVDITIETELEPKVLRDVSVCNDARRLVPTGS